MSVPVLGGAVSTSHFLATAAGAEALRRGGNALDAAIAAAATLCVVYPNNVALGGDLVALVKAPSGEVSFVNATGRAPADVDVDRMRERYGDRLPDRGIDTITVPGGVRGWEMLAGLGARQSWPELLESAHRHAEDGHLLAPSVAAALVGEQDILRSDPGFREVFYPDGEPLAEGATLRQPALAGTLAALRAGGPEAFYAGPVADAWVAGLRRLGSAITTADARSFRPHLDEPLERRVFGRRIITGPPNTQGFALLRNLLAAEREHLRAPLGADAGRFAEIFAETNRVRAYWLADPDAGLSGAELLDAEVPPRADDEKPAHGDTVGLVAVSDDGWAVSLVQSVYWSFGSGVLEPVTGVLFQNRGTSFSLEQKHPALLAPGRRPPHSLMPVLVFDDDRLDIVPATMGGQAQAQIHAQLFLRLRDGAAVAEAIEAPRFVVGAQDDGDTQNTVLIESDVAPDARAALARTTLDPRIVPPYTESLGHSNVIRATSDGWDAASDPRSDGSAEIVPPATTQDIP
ncbi:gamma-glutamyltransferase [Microbacterium sp. 1P10UB]|uniref:gamma-glutamyltransferase family protein n=1 Tax=unclassified Microbacterium TaxID=2609290 RepID=UPI00399F7381